MNGIQRCMDGAAPDERVPVCYAKAMAAALLDSNSARYVVLTNENAPWRVCGAVFLSFAHLLHRAAQLVYQPVPLEERSCLDAG